MVVELSLAHNTVKVMPQWRPERERNERGGSCTIISNRSLNIVCKKKHENESQEPGEGGPRKGRRPEPGQNFNLEISVHLV